jgi:hypothetical protein
MSADPIYEHAPVEDKIIKRKSVEHVLSMAYHYFSTGRVRWY